MTTHSGDRDLQILEDCYARLRRAAIAVGAPGTDPDDLVQEVVARALRGGSLARLDEPASYLCRAIVNLAIDEQRRRTRLKRALARTGRATTETSDPYPSDIADLYTLPPNERAALYLADVERWSFTEIAKALNCSVNAARSRVQRARLALRLQLAKEELDV